MKMIERAYPAVFVVMALAIVGFAAWARIYGLGFALPFIFDRDEQAFIIPAVTIVDSGNLNPGWFGHPASTVIYAGAVISFFVSLFSEHGALASYYQDPTLTVYFHRLFCALFGVAAVPATYLLAKTATRSPASGLIAAAFMAVLPLHIDLSRIVRSDVVAATFIIFAAYFALRALETGRPRDYVFHGIMVGLATMTKWPAVTISSMIVIAHLFRPSPVANWRLLLLAGAASIVAAFVVAPFVFLDWQTVLTNLKAEGRSQNYAASGEGFLGNMAYYAKAFRGGLGWWVLVPAFAGIVLALKLLDRRMLTLLLFSAGFMLFIASLNLKYVRWALPVFPFIGVFFAYGVVQVSSLVLRYLPIRVPVAAVATLTGILLLIPTVSKALWRVDVHTRTDTRIASRDWILENVPAGSTILVESYTPQLPIDVFNVGQWGRGRNRDKFQPAPTDKHRNFIAGAFSGEADVLKVIADGKPQYIVMSSSSYGRFDLPGYEQQRLNVETIFKQGEIVYEARPGKEAKGGPLISVIKLP